MAQPQTLEGTGEELQRMLAQFPHDRFRLVPLLKTEATIEQNETNSEEGGSLYDLLGDYIGSVDGSGENSAARAREIFMSSESHLHP